MIRTLRLALPLLLLVAFAAPARAQNKQELQMLAELRIMQERMQQIQLEVNKLLDLIKTSSQTLTARADAQESTFRNNYAQQKAQVDSMATQFSALASQAQDNSVRMGVLSTEMNALREGVQMAVTLISQVLAQIPAAAQTTTQPADPSGQPTPVVIPPSPKTLFDQAMGFYATGTNLDLAINGFEEYLAKFPTGADAARAQLLIGRSHAALSPPQHQKAIDAYSLVISNPTYKGSDAVPEAYYRQGLEYETLKKPELAIKAYQTIARDFKESSWATMATMALGRLKAR